MRRELEMQWCGLRLHRLIQNLGSMIIRAAYYFSNHLKQNNMKKYIVLQKIGSFSPDVKRTFDELDDARAFVALLKKSDTNSCVAYFIAETQEE